MSSDTRLAARIMSAGFTLADAARLNPSDRIEGVLALRRRDARRVLVFPPMTAKEAAFRLIEARDQGWQPVRWLRLGPERHPLAHLAWRHA